MKKVDNPTGIPMRWVYTAGGDIFGEDKSGVYIFKKNTLSWHKANVNLPSDPEHRNAVLKQHLEPVKK